MKLVSHINNDGDLLQAWFDYYMNLGVTSFHLIVHGSRQENATLFRLKDSYPIVIEDTYDGTFTSEEKHRRLTTLLHRLRGEWLFLLDSDEFVELPYTPVTKTIRILELLGANALYAPMLQRLTRGGSIDTPEMIRDPFSEFPLGSVELYEKMGVRAAISKYPLFRCDERTSISDGGNHGTPHDSHTLLSPLRGVTHHFKWRSIVRKRLTNRINSPHTWRHQSVGFLAFLEKSSLRLPLADSFVCTRAELLHRGLIVKAATGSTVKHFLKRFLKYLPGPLEIALANSYHYVRRASRRALPSLAGARRRGQAGRVNY